MGLVAIAFVAGFGIASVVFIIEPLPSTTPLSITDKCSNRDDCIPDIDIFIERELTEVGQFKNDLASQIAHNPIIIDALKKSNEEFSSMSPEIRNGILAQREQEWTSVGQLSPFMDSIINNDIADFLKEKTIIQSEKFGDVVFGEHILTNTYGANVAVTVRTDNYNQANDAWWQESKKIGTLVRNCDFDTSAQIFSEDIVVKIFDKKGEFLGIMNSATPCDVTKKSEEQTKIEPIPLDNITSIGNYKISYLKEIVNESIIQNALSESNKTIDANCTNILKLKEEKEINAWPDPNEGTPTSLQLELLQNMEAIFLQENLQHQSEEFGDIVFFEFILTDACGVNVAITELTYDYVQYPYEWWQVTKANDTLIRQCGWDRSVQMSSEDIIISIYDKNGKFVGILNSATACDIILNKPPAFYGDSN